MPTVMSVPPSALLTGHPVLAAWAASSKPAASIPSASPRTVRAIPVIFMPPFGSGPKVTSAVTSSDCGLAPLSSRAFVRDIA